MHREKDTEGDEEVIYTPQLGSSAKPETETEFGIMSIDGDGNDVAPASGYGYGYERGFEDRLTRLDSSTCTVSVPASMSTSTTTAIATTVPISSTTTTSMSMSTSELTKHPDSDSDCKPQADTYMDLNSNPSNPSSRSPPSPSHQDHRPHSQSHIQVQTQFTSHHHPHASPNTASASPTPSTSSLGSLSLPGSLSLSASVYASASASAEEGDHDADHLPRSRLGLVSRVGRRRGALSLSPRTLFGSGGELKIPTLELPSMCMGMEMERRGVGGRPRGRVRRREMLRVLVLDFGRGGYVVGDVLEALGFEDGDGEWEVLDDEEGVGVVYNKERDIWIGVVRREWLKVDYILNYITRPFHQINTHLNPNSRRPTRLQRSLLTNKRLPFLTCAVMIGICNPPITSEIELLNRVSTLLPTITLPPIIRERSSFFEPCTMGDLRSGLVYRAGGDGAGRTDEEVGREKGWRSDLVRDALMDEVVDAFLRWRIRLADHKDHHHIHSHSPPLLHRHILLAPTTDPLHFGAWLSLSIQLLELRIHKWNSKSTWPYYWVSGVFVMGVGFGIWVRDHGVLYF